jgi:hypothetical protein
MFEWGLFENAIDYLGEAVRRLEGEADRRDLKYAILHLGSGLELLLKERLRQDDWRQLFRDPDEATEEVYRSGDFISANVWQTMNRLGKISEVEISATDRAHIGTLRDRRNPLEHFRIRESREAVSAAASSALGFALEFISGELEDETLDPDLRAELNEIRSALPELQEFVAHRLAEVESQISQGATVVECPRCFQETAVIEDGMHCVFCGFVFGLDRIEAGAEDWIAAVLGISEYQIVKEGGEMPLSCCPNCTLRAFVDRGNIGGEYSGERWVCLACGDTRLEGSMTHCARCGELFDSSDGGTVCSDCFHAAVAE